MLNLPSLGLRRLQIDLVWCYKTVFGMVDVHRLSPVAILISYINLALPTLLLGHFFACRIINVWNSLPKTTDFSTINALRHAISDVDLAEFLVLTQDT